LLYTETNLILAVYTKACHQLAERVFVDIEALANRLQPCQNLVSPGFELQSRALTACTFTTRSSKRVFAFHHIIKRYLLADRKQANLRRKLMSGVWIVDLRNMQNKLLNRLAVTRDINN